MQQCLLQKRDDWLVVKLFIFEVPHNLGQNEDKDIGQVCVGFKPLLWAYLVSQLEHHLDQVEFCKRVRVRRLDDKPDLPQQKHHRVLIVSELAECRKTKWHIACVVQQSRNMLWVLA